MNESIAPILLLTAGLIAGSIDSVAGGGGLITVPTLSHFLGANAEAIATNKIPGLAAAAAALIVYSLRGHMDWGRSFVFAGWVAVGSFCGSRLAPTVPPEIYRIFLFVSCPLILWIVFRKDLWVEREAKAHRRLRDWRTLVEPGVVASGLACGFYDGIWGPGGGTFMFLALVFIARLPLLSALAAAKLANTVSAATGLINYASMGLVKWETGAWLGVGMIFGALFGASFATKGAARLVRPALAVVVTLLLASFFFRSRA